jgi:hypothetical protein
VLGLIALLLLAAIVTAALALTSSGSGPEAHSHPVTASEAARLGGFRERNFQAGGVHFSTTVNTRNGRIPLSGDVDFRAGLGYALARAANNGELQGAVLQWNRTNLATWVGGASLTVLPTRPPLVAAQTRALSPSRSALDTALLILLDLGADRTDSPALLERADATWLRSATLNGVKVDVFRGPTPGPVVLSGGSAAPGAPSTTEYWIDAAGTLRRLDTQLSTGPLVIDLNPATYRPFPRSSVLS